MPCVVLCGVLGHGAQELLDAGFAGVWPILPAPASRSELLSHTAEYLTSTARSVGGLWAAGAGLIL